MKDRDGTPIKLNLRVSDNCPKCGNKGTLKIYNIAYILCLACGRQFNRWVKVNKT